MREMVPQQNQTVFLGPKTVMSHVSAGAVSRDSDCSGAGTGECGISNTEALRGRWRD